MTFDEAASVFVLVMTAVLLAWRYRPRAFFARLGATLTYLAHQFTYGAPEAQSVNHYESDITSSELQGRPRTGSEPPENQAGSPDTSAERTSSDDEQDDDTPRLHNRMSRLELLTLLAVQRTSEGEYLFSANKIADLVGGARQKTLEQINEVRGVRKEDEPPPRATTHLSRPENGWR